MRSRDLTLLLGLLGGAGGLAALSRFGGQKSGVQMGNETQGPPNIGVRMGGEAQGPIDRGARPGGGPQGAPTAQAVARTLGAPPSITPGGIDIAQGGGVGSMSGNLPYAPGAPGVPSFAQSPGMSGINPEAPRPPPAGPGMPYLDPFIQMLAKSAGMSGGAIPGAIGAIGRGTSALGLSGLAGGGARAGLPMAGEVLPPAGGAARALPPYAPYAQFSEVGSLPGGAARALPPGAAGTPQSMSAAGGPSAIPQALRPQLPPPQSGPAIPMPSGPAGPTWGPQTSMPGGNMPWMTQPQAGGFPQWEELAMRAGMRTRGAPNPWLNMNRPGVQIPGLL